MNSKLTVLSVSLALAFVGCSSLGNASTGTWRASVDNGDKPGIGIELVRTSDGVHGWMHLLDPIKPHDFAAGSRHQMDIHEASDEKLRFTVEWLPNHQEELILRFSSPLTGRSVHGVLESADGQDQARDYEFTRTR